MGCVTAPRKSRAFLSFQISHATRAKMESAPCLYSPAQRLRQTSHHSRTLSQCLNALVSFSAALMFHQICLAYEQVTTMWSMVSGSWSQRRQLACVSRP